MTEFHANAGCNRSDPYRHQGILSLAAARRAEAAIAAWPGYRPTPLLDLAPIAARCGVASVHYKQEGERFGLSSFKALGGAYAIERLIARRAGSQGLVVTSATDGNHGRSVAWGAARHGIPCIIYIHESVSERRADAIAALGAEVRRVPGNYDDAVRAAAAAAETNGWVVVSDTSWPGYEEIPKDVMQGYAVMAMEAADQMQGVRPTHIVLQGGVGGMAASIVSYHWETDGNARPYATIVEPDRAACLFASARSGSMTSVTGELDTIMAGLACGEPSMLAWSVLSDGADAFMTIPDRSAERTMRELAALHVVAGESAVAGLAGFIAAAANLDWRNAMGLDGRSRVLCFGTEGATDPEIYTRIVGKDPRDIWER
jgi:diaminopropionate ammonia-lyase